MSITKLYKDSYKNNDNSTQDDNDKPGADGPPRPRRSRPEAAGAAERNAWCVRSAKEEKAEDESTHTITHI